MSDEQPKVGRPIGGVSSGRSPKVIRLGPEAKGKLDKLARAHVRNESQEIEWLILKEPMP